MEMMHWYNPTTREEEEVPAPMSYAQAIELTGSTGKGSHPGSRASCSLYNCSHPSAPVLGVLGSLWHKEGPGSAESPFPSANGLTPPPRP